MLQCVPAFVVASLTEGMQLVDRRQRPAAPASADPEPQYAALVARHRSGDPAALNALMTALYPSIYRIVYRLAGARDREQHEDLVQASLEQVCRSIDAFEGRSRVTTFVFGICHRVVARSRRYDRVRTWFRRDAEEATLPQGSAAPDDLIDRGRAVASARAALDNARRRGARGVRPARGRRAAARGRGGGVALLHAHRQAPLARGAREAPANKPERGRDRLGAPFISAVRPRRRCSRGAPGGCTRRRPIGLARTSTAARAAGRRWSTSTRCTRALEPPPEPLFLRQRQINEVRRRLEERPTRRVPWKQMKWAALCGAVAGFALVFALHPRHPSPAARRRRLRARVAPGRGRRRGRRRSRGRRSEDGAARGRLAHGGAVVAGGGDVGRCPRRRRRRADRRARAARREPRASAHAQARARARGARRRSAGAGRRARGADRRFARHRARHALPRRGDAGRHVGRGRSRARARHWRAHARRRCRSPDRPGRRAADGARCRLRGAPGRARRAVRRRGRPRASMCSPMSPTRPSTSTASSTGARRCRWR